MELSTAESDAKELAMKDVALTLSVSRSSVRCGSVFPCTSTVLTGRALIRVCCMFVYLAENRPVGQVGAVQEENH